MVCGLRGDGVLRFRFSRLANYKSFIDNKPMEQHPRNGFGTTELLLLLGASMIIVGVTWRLYITNQPTDVNNELHVSRQNEQVISGVITEINNDCQAEGLCTVMVDETTTILTGCSVPAAYDNCDRHNGTTLQLGDTISIVAKRNIDDYFEPICESLTCSLAVTNVARIFEDIPTRDIITDQVRQVHIRGQVSKVFDDRPADGNAGIVIDGVYRVDTEVNGEFVLTRGRKPIQGAIDDPFKVGDFVEVAARETGENSFIVEGSEELYATKISGRLANQ